MCTQFVSIASTLQMRKTRPDQMHIEPICIVEAGWNGILSVWAVCLFTFLLYLAVTPMLTGIATMGNSEQMPRMLVRAVVRITLGE